MDRGKRPKITWGASFANTLTFGVALDDAINRPRRRDGSVSLRYPSGVDDAWTVGVDEILSGRARWVPITDTVTPVAATGWDGATGWRAFLVWAMDKQPFRYYPDAAGSTYYLCYLDDPATMPDVTLEKGYQHRSIPLTMRVADDTPVTGY